MSRVWHGAAMSDLPPAQRALAAVTGSGVPFTVVTHGPVSSLAQAAAARGVTPDRILKTLVVRRGEDDHLFVLVPGGRTISWPKLRGLLGVNRLSMPDAAAAQAVTGYERGTITPFGSLRALPVVADAAIQAGPVSIGGGAHGTAFTVDSADLVEALGAQVADVSEPEPSP
jgi:Cys-tRNA(Pro) deacylase